MASKTMIEFTNEALDNILRNTSGIQQKLGRGKAGKVDENKFSDVFGLVIEAETKIMEAAEAVERLDVL